MEGKVYTVKELMETLKVSETVMLRELQTGNIKGIKIGRQWRVTEENLKKYLNGEVCNS